MSTLIVLAMVAAEPVVLTPLADPDSGLVAPRSPAPRRASAVKVRSSAAAARGSTSLEEAFANLDRAVQAARATALRKRIRKRMS